MRDGDGVHHVASGLNVLGWQGVGLDDVEHRQGHVQDDIFRR